MILRCSGAVAAVCLASIAVTGKVSAVAATFHVTNSSCSGAGSLQAAVADANANPGVDTISIDITSFEPNCAVAREGGSPGGFQDMNNYELWLTESAVIEGNGATISRPAAYWIGPGGTVNSWSSVIGSINCINTPDNIVLTQMSGVLKVGRWNQDNTGVNVTLRNLNVHDMGSLLRVEKGAAATLDNVSATSMWPFSSVNQCPGRPSFEMYEGADLTIRNSHFLDFRTDNDLISTSLRLSAAIIEGGATFNGHAGNLLIENSQFERMLNGHLVNWQGGRVDIVSSRLYDSGALVANGDTTTNIVNTLWDPSVETGLYRDFTRKFVQNSTNPMTFTASTVNFADQLACPNTIAASYPSCAVGNPSIIVHDPALVGLGEIRFRSTVINIKGGQFYQEGNLLDPRHPGVFQADHFTYVHTTAGQNTATLRTLTNQPALVTTGAALRDDIAIGSIDNAFLHAVPIRGTADAPGVLIDAIPNALCGQANQLLHPLTGECIDTDVAGRARVDGNNFRDIGAIQLQAAPHLALMEKNPTNVTLGWMQSFPFNGNFISSYDLCYGPSINNASPDPMAIGATCPGALEPAWVADPGLSPTAVLVTGQKTGLTPGKALWFMVRARGTAGALSEWSNALIVMPLGPLSPPTFTRAVGGNGSVALTWQPPAVVGGRTGYVYTLIWRVHGGALVGAIALDKATLSYTVGGLVNGTRYDFLIAAHDDADATTSAQDLIDGTPTEVGAPVVSASAGDRSARVSFVPPPTPSGATVLQFILLWRVAGTADYVGGIGLTPDQTSYTATGLTNCTEYEFSVRMVTDKGTGPDGYALATPSAGYTPLTPARLLDTRPTGTTVDGQGVGSGALGAAGVVTVTVLGRGGVPSSGVGSVVLNVTAIAPTAPGYVTVYPAGSTRPTASSLNVVRSTVANTVIAKVGSVGEVSIFNANGSTHLAVDVVGWFPADCTFNAMVPSRLIDTRAGGVTIDGAGSGQGSLAPGSSLRVQVVGRGGVPASGAGSVAVNVTAIAPTATGFLTVHPSDESRPNASSVNISAGVTRANLVIAKLGADGTITVYNQNGATHVAVDVIGWFPAHGVYKGFNPTRLVDSRVGGTTVDGLDAGGGSLGAGSQVDVTVTGRAGVPATGVGAVVLNVVAVAPTAAGFVTVFPTGETRPNSSSVNVAPGSSSANLVIAKVGSNGKVTVYNANGETHLVVDIVGWLPITTLPA
jgi:hypothetical protein